MVLPCTNNKLRAATAQRDANYCRPGDYLSMDVEQDLSRLIKAEVDLHIETEELKQKLESARDFEKNAAYKSVDYTNIGHIDMKCLDNFFKRVFTKNVQIEDNAAIIRRLDLDCDGKLNLEEFLKGI